MCISVDLPEPDGPMTAVRCSLCDVEVDAAQRVDGRLALAVVARDVARAHRDLGRRVAAISRRDGH